MKSIILRPSQVARMLGISKPTIWRLEKKGDFPPKIQLGSNMTGYLADDIEEWISKRITEGDPDRIKGCVARAMSCNVNRKQE